MRTQRDAATRIDQRRELVMAGETEPVSLRCSKKEWVHHYSLSELLSKSVRLLQGVNSLRPNVNKGSIAGVRRALSIDRSRSIAHLQPMRFNTRS